ncbi:MAG: tetratricopeptide repeat protein [Phycisphaerae bacterium]|nr:tetratricopeptide repeat protein [Phycisphaerae bacterium]
MADDRGTLVRFLASSACLLATAQGCSRGDSSDEPNIPRGLFETASKSFAEGRYDEAAAELERVLRAYPMRLDARRLRAYALAALGRFDEVDQVLRATPIPTTTAPPEPSRSTSEDDASADKHAAPAEQQAAIMLWRRAFNIYRYYYHVTSPSPKGVFRARTIRDALEAGETSELAITEAAGLRPMKLAGVLKLLRLWVRWDGVARDADLHPHRQWLPLLVVSETDRLSGAVDALVRLEGQAEGGVWLHPDDHGHWLAHPGAVDVEATLLGGRESARSDADVLTETAGPAAGVLQGWETLADWLAQNVPDACVTLIAAVRAEPDRPFDQRLALIGRLKGDEFHVEQIGLNGPVDALVFGRAEYRRLLHDKRVMARSDTEIESLAAAYLAAGQPADGFRADGSLQIFAEDRELLARLLSYVRYGSALFGQARAAATDDE